MNHHILFLSGRSLDLAYHHQGRRDYSLLLDSVGAHSLVCMLQLAARSLKAEGGKVEEVFLPFCQNLGFQLQSRLAALDERIAIGLEVGWYSDDQIEAIASELESPGAIDGYLQDSFDKRRKAVLGK